MNTHHHKLSKVPKLTAEILQVEHPNQHGKKTFKIKSELGQIKARLKKRHRKRQSNYNCGTIQE